MKLYAFLFFILFTFLSVNVDAQSHCNCALVASNQSLIDNLIEGKKEKELILFLDKIDQKNSACVFAYNSLMLQLYIKLNQSDSVQKYLSVLKQKQLTSKCSINKLEYLYFNGYVFLKKEQYDSASSNLIAAIELAESIKDDLYLAKSQLSFALVFAKLGQPLKAISYGKKGLEVAVKINNDKLILSGSTNLQSDYGQLYDKTENHLFLDTIKQLCFNTLLLAKQLNSKKETIRSYVTLAGVYLSKKEYLSSLLYCDSAIYLSDRSIHQSQLHSAYYKASLCFLELKQYKQAIVAADSALVLADNKTKKGNAYYRLYEINKKTGNYQEALAFHEILKELDMDALNSDRMEAVTELEQKYEKAKNEKTIKELNQESEIKNLRIRSLIFVIILIVLVLLIIVIVFRQKSIKNKQVIIETEQRLNRARINPHFFFNALTTLQGLAVRENDGKKVAINLYKFSSLMRKTLESSYNDYVTIEKELEFINQYIELQTLKESSKFNYVLCVDESINVSEVLIPSMLIQPFLENSIEHGFAGIDYKAVLELTITIKEKNLVIKISDNGKGLIKNEHKNDSHISRAIQITKDRLYLINKEKKINCSYSISDNVPHGVVIELVLPLL